MKSAATARLQMTIGLGLTYFALFIYPILAANYEQGSILYGASITFRLLHEYEPTDALASETRQTLTKPLATGCSEAELLRA